VTRDYKDSVVPATVRVRALRQACDKVYADLLERAV
jgi:hypothetical protein